MVVRFNPSYNDVKRLEKAGLGSLPRHAQKFSGIRGRQCLHNFQAVLQPGLIRMCQQIRNEALPLYYQHHAFQFNLYNKPTMQEDMREWLLSIGEIGRRNIRHFVFRFLEGHETLGAGYYLIKIMDRLHAVLPTQSIAIYKCSGYARVSLIHLAEHFAESNGGKRPRVQKSTWSETFHDCGHDGQAGAIELRMTFEPNMGWFGGDAAGSPSSSQAVP